MKQGPWGESRGRGFTLVELLIAMALGLMLMALLGSLFVDVSRTNRDMARSAGLVESARFALRLMSDDLVHAGYWAGFIPEFDDRGFLAAPTDVPTRIPDPCLAFANWDTAHRQALIGIPIQVHASTPAGCVRVRDKVAESDLLVVRHAATCSVGQTGCAPEASGKIYFQPSRCRIEIEAGVSHVLDVMGFGLHARDCEEGPPVTGSIAPKYRYVSNIYYIRDWATSAGDGMPTLVRSSFDTAAGTPAQQPAVPLVEGIEGLRVEIGVDHLAVDGNDIVTATDAAERYTAAIAWIDPREHALPRNRGDGIPDGFRHCADDCSAAEMTHVVALRIHILARTSEPVPGHVDDVVYRLGDLQLGPFHDGFMRHVFSTTVRLANVADRRRVP